MKRSDEQFEIADTRDVNEVFEAIKSGGLQPVMSDYINLTKGYQIRSNMEKEGREQEKINRP